MMQRRWVCFKQLPIIVRGAVDQKNKVLQSFKVADCYHNSCNSLCIIILHMDLQKLEVYGKGNLYLDLLAQDLKRGNSFRIAMDLLVSVA